MPYIWQHIFASQGFLVHSTLHKPIIGNGVDRKNLASEDDVDTRTYSNQINTRKYSTPSTRVYCTTDSTERARWDTIPLKVSTFFWGFSHLKMYMKGFVGQLANM